MSAEEITDRHVLAQALRQVAAMNVYTTQPPRPKGTQEWLYARADELDAPSDIDKAIAAELRNLLVVWAEDDVHGSPITALWITARMRERADELDPPR